MDAIVRKNKYKEAYDVLIQYLDINYRDIPYDKYQEFDEALDLALELLKEKAENG